VNGNVYGAVITALTLRETKVHQVHLLNIARAPGVVNLLDQADQLEPEITRTDSYSAKFTITINTTRPES